MSGLFILYLIRGHRCEGRSNYFCNKSTLDVIIITPIVPRGSLSLVHVVWACACMVFCTGACFYPRWRRATARARRRAALGAWRSRQLEG